MSAHAGSAIDPLIPETALPETAAADTAMPEMGGRPHSLIAASRVAGTPVYNTANERLGTIEDVMIDKQSGRAVYALLSFGGFLGIGDKHHPLPWQALRYDVVSGGYVVDLDRSRLQGAPIVDEGSYDTYQDEAWGRRVHDYYDVAPYWSVLP